MLVMVNVDTHKQPYGTIMQVTKEKRGEYVCSTAETDRIVVIKKEDVKEI